MKSLCITGNTEQGVDQLEILALKAGLEPARPAPRTPEISMADWHQAVLAETSGNLSGVGRTPSKLWEKIASDLFMTHRALPLWFWADARSVALLDFWHDFDNSTHFLLVYTNPVSALARALRHGLVNEDTTTSYLDQWIQTTRHMVRFYLRHPARSTILSQNHAHSQGLDNALQDLLGIRVSHAVPTHVDDAIMATPTTAHEQVLHHLVSQYLNEHPLAFALHEETLACMAPEYSDDERAVQPLSAQDALSFFLQLPALNQTPDATQAPVTPQAQTHAAAHLSETETATTHTIAASPGVTPAATMASATTTVDSFKTTAASSTTAPAYPPPKTGASTATPTEPGHTLAGWTCEHISVTPQPLDGKSQWTHWTLKDLSFPGRTIPYLRLKTLTRPGLNGVVILRNGSADDPLQRWPALFAHSHELPCLPVTGEPYSVTNNALSLLSPSDWNMLQGVTRYLTDRLTQVPSHQLPATFDRDQVVQGLTDFIHTLQRWPHVLRYLNMTTQPFTTLAGAQGLEIHLQQPVWENHVLPDLCYHLIGDVSPNASLPARVTLHFPETSCAVFESWSGERHNPSDTSGLTLRCARPDTLDYTIWGELSKRDQRLIQALVSVLTHGMPEPSAHTRDDSTDWPATAQWVATTLARHSHPTRT